MLRRSDLLAVSGFARVDWCLGLRVCIAISVWTYHFSLCVGWVLLFRSCAFVHAALISFFLFCTWGI